MLGHGQNKISDLISLAIIVWRFNRGHKEMFMRQSKRQTHRKANSNEPLQPSLSIADVCRMFGLSRPKIHDLIVHEGLPTIKFGRAVRISPTSLQRWLASREEIA